jgi:phage tail-like protein
MTDTQNYYPPVGFYFKVMVEGGNEKYEAGFAEASGLNAKIGTDEKIEGGENRFKSKLPTDSKYANLILKRGLVTGQPFMKWINEAVLHFKFQTKTVNVMLMDEKGAPLVNWTFYNAYPVSVKVSDLKIAENNYSIESLELAYDYFQRVDNKTN